jgi:competence protein ComEC
MTLARPPLFRSGRDLLLFLSAALLIFSLSIYLKYESYCELMQFDDTLIQAHVIDQYLKNNNKRTYHILKLQIKNSVLFTSASEHLRDLRGRDVEVKIWPETLSFIDFLKGSYLRSHILKVHPMLDAKTSLSHHIAAQHSSKLAGELFSALFTAAPMSKTLKQKLSQLGLSHLLAISGFHLGIVSALLYFLFKPPYRLFQERYFPYRSSSKDLFVIIVIFLTSYLYFLGMIPSLLRAYTMLIVGFILYDRGIKIISMQTLFLTVVLLIAFMPSLLLSIGFWLSVCGVFYIFVYLIHFQQSNHLYNLTGLSLWVYFMMLPISLYLFETFSLYHPLSVVATLLFLPFYLLGLVLHVFSFGGVFDWLLMGYLKLGTHAVTISLPLYFMAFQTLLSLLCIRYKTAALLLLGFCLAIFGSAVYEVT